ncbi:hypothetical protein ACWEWD_14365 [Streptomyces tendae]
MSAARPGRTHDNTAARHNHILAHLRAVGLGALADLPLTAFSPSDGHRSSTASPTSRTGGSSPSSAPTPPKRPVSCAPCSF